jgi:hypothetical protein
MRHARRRVKCHTEFKTLTPREETAWWAQAWMRGSYGVDSTIIGWGLAYFVEISQHGGEPCGVHNACKGIP